MAKVYLNRAWMTTATTGTGTMTLGSAVAGYLTFAEAGIANADTVTYVIRDGDDFELGVGTYTSSGTTLSRDTVIVSKISGTAGTTKLTLSGSAEVFAAPAAADLVTYDASGRVGIGIAPTGKFDVDGTIRSRGAGSPSSGAGLEMIYDSGGGGICYLVAYDRTGASFLPLNIQASEIRFTSGGVYRGNINSAGAFRLLTDAGANPGAVVARHWTSLTADYTLTSTTSEQKAFNNPTNGELTLATGVYEFECFLYLTTMSATSGNFAFDPIGGGTAVADRFGYFADGIDNSSPLNAGARTGSASVTQQSPASVVTAGTGTGAVAMIRGMFRVTTAGTIIPSVSLVTAAAAVVKAGSYFKCAKIGETSETYVGAWT